MEKGLYYDGRYKVGELRVRVGITACTFEIRLYAYCGFCVVLVIFVCY